MRGRCGARIFRGGCSSIRYCRERGLGRKRMRWNIGRGETRFERKERFEKGGAVMRYICEQLEVIDMLGRECGKRCRCMHHAES